MQFECLPQCACVCVCLCCVSVCGAAFACACVCARVRGGKVICFFRPSVCNTGNREQQTTKRKRPKTNCYPAVWQHCTPPPFNPHTQREVSLDRTCKMAAGRQKAATTRIAKEQIQIEFDIECVAPTGGCLTQLVDRSVRVSFLPFSFDFHCEFVQCCQLSQLSGHVFAAAAS